jgi:hypothetical protein
VPRLLTADDIIPLVASLTDTERMRLLRWVASPHGSDASIYAAAPPTIDEFSGDDDPIAWEADGWEGQDALGALRSRVVEQDVLDILDDPQSCWNERNLLDSSQK